MRIEHPSIDASRRDSATVTPSGRPLSQSIAGVVANAPVNHVDHRGRVFEIYGGETTQWEKPVVYCYCSTVRAGQTKGWALHEHKDDRYTLISGELLIHLYDARSDSPTYGLGQEVTLTPEGMRQLLIPAGVWHLSVCLSPTEAFLVNHPTHAYNHGAPDRLLLPWNTPDIPVDVGARFPIQFSS